MSKTKTPEQLLIVALQDLNDADLAWRERGPGLRDAAGDEVKRFVDAQIALSSAHHEHYVAILEQLGGDLEGDPNIWLRAILDDAERDVASIMAGPLRDTALVGAFRKGKQAQRVSLETAMALAQRLGLDAEAATLRICRDEEQSADDDLAALLAIVARR